MSNNVRVLANDNVVTTNQANEQQVEFFKAENEKLRKRIKETRAETAKMREQIKTMKKLITLLQ
jgi:septal ring factor EnvC (AmiA/AmiB activator)